MESYHGKYKKMNCGKYLYKHTSNNEKKILCTKKKKLKYFSNTFVDAFKQFLVKLNKKDEEKKFTKKRKKITSSKDVTQSNQDNRFATSSNQYAYDNYYRPAPEENNNFTDEQQSKFIIYN